MTNGAFRAFVLRWGDIAWRLVAIGVVVFFAFRILQTISVVVFAVVFALFLAAVLWRPAQWLMERGWKPALASMATIVMATLALAGLIVFIIPQVADSVDTLSEDVTETWESLHDWLIEGPLGLTQQEIDQYTERIGEWLQGIGGDRLIGGATAILEFITGAFLVVVITFFMLKDGRTILEKTLARTPEETAAKVAIGARVARESLAKYMGGIALVGLFDATLIGVALWIVGTPLVFPLALLVFFGAYIPLVGAFLSGLLAVAVTFVNIGPIQALIILAVAVVVQQFEGDVIMPLIFGSRLRLHPLVVLLAVAAGGLAFGLAGAFLAVPLIAVSVSVHEAIGDDPDGSYLQLARG